MDKDMLTKEEIESVKHGEAAAMRLGDTDCVVIRRDVYERLKNAVYDDSDFSPRETYHAVDKALNNEEG